MSTSKQRRELAERLRMLRHERGFTVRQFSRLMGISYQAVYRIESGHRILYFEEAIQLADVLGVSLDYLAGRK